MDDEDRRYYRRTVISFMKTNKVKYPSTGAMIAISIHNGTIDKTVELLGDVLDSAFAMNMPIAECARMVEETCTFAKNKAEEMFLMMKVEGGSIH